MTAQIVSKLSQFLKTGLKEGTTIAGERFEKEAIRAGVKPEELDFAKLPVDPNKRYTQAELSSLNRERDDLFSESLATPREAVAWRLGEASGGVKLVQYPDYVLDRVHGSPNYRERITKFSKHSDEEALEYKTEELIANWKAYKAASTREEQVAISNKTDSQFKFLLQDAESEDDIRWAVQDTYPGGRFASNHFDGVPNYLMHTRYADDVFQGEPARVLMEIQSDLHQGERLGDVIGLDASPWKNSWLRKGIERELVDAHNKGLKKVAIPISETGVTLTPAARELFEKTRTAYAESSKQFEEVDKLRAKQSKLKAVVHSDNATKSYVLNAAEEAGVQLDPNLPLDALLKQARRASYNLFKETEEAYEVYRSKLKAYHEVMPLLRKENPALAHELHNSVPTNPDFYASVDEWAEWTKSGKLIPLKRGDGVQTWYETEVRDTAKKIAKATGSEFEEVVDDGVKYAVIRPKGDFNVSLYSSPVAAYFGMRVALDEGQHSEEELQAFAAEQGYDYDEIKRGAELIAEARKEGHSDEEIKGFLDSQVPTMKEEESEEILSPPLAPTESVRAATKPEQDLGITLKEFGQMTAGTLTGKFPMKTPEQVAKQEARYQEAKKIVETGEDTRPFYRRWTEVPPEVRVKLVEEQKGTAYAELVSDEGLPLEKIVANLQTVQPNMTSVFTRTGAWFGNEGDRRLAQEAQLASRKKIIQAANAMPEFQSRGLRLDWVFTEQEDGTPSDYGNVFTDDGQFVVIDAQGQKTPLTPGFIESIRAEGYEISGAVAGAIAGTRVGANVPGPWPVKAGAAFVGSVLGAAGLATAGSQLDYLQNALLLQQELDGTVAASRALSAGQTSVIGDVLAWPIAKGISASASSLVQLKNRLIDGREYSALKELFFVSDDELEAMRQGLLKVTDLPGSVKSQRIAAYALTQPGGEDLLRQVSNVNPKASRAVSRAIDLRAKDVLRTADEVADKDIARLLSQDLSNYTSDVKAFYQSVKEQAAAAPRASQFVFNFDELGLEPALTAMEKELVDPTAVERYMRRAHVIRSRSDARGFADLLELRQLVNEFKFGSGMKKATDLKIFNDTLAKIDEAIDQGADIVLNNPQQWKAQYAAARAKYAEMKSLERNVLARALRRPGIDTDAAVEKLTRYISASDDTFADVLNVLPKQAREKVENSVIKAVAEKYTAGIGEAVRASHFPMMAEELKKMPFTTQYARRMKAALIQLGDTFKNDVAIGQHTGSLSIPQFQSYLTADPKVRLQYEFATSIFNHVRRFGPGQANRALSLVMKTGKLLESPLNAKTAKELADLAAGEVDVVPSIVQMQQHAARQAAGSKDPMATRVKLWGDGDKLSLRGSGTPTATIPIHRIATAEQVNVLAAKYGINPADTKALDWALQQEGFKAVAQGTEKVRILK